MNGDIVVGIWKQWKGQMWLLWAEWFDNDAAWTTGNNDWFSGIVQEDYGRERLNKVSPVKTPH